MVNDEVACPICRDYEKEYFTECGHQYCIRCLCRIKTCALCRKTLIRSELCVSILEKAKGPEKTFSNPYDSWLYSPNITFW